MQSTRLKKNFPFRIEIALPSAINENDFLFQGEMSFYLFIQQTCIEHICGKSLWQKLGKEMKRETQSLPMGNLDFNKEGRR